MTCITKILELKGDKEFLPINDVVVVEGGGSYRDYEFLITFVRDGHRCAYVALKQTDVDKFEEELGDATYRYPESISCHWGCSFYDRDSQIKDVLPIPCDDMWFGFDAAHCHDKPDLEKSKYYFDYIPLGDYFENGKSIYDKFPEMIHRSYEFMEENCKSIIDQLVERNGNE